MGSPFFRFKQFTVWHDRCAMKVGTDGVLLGAWCPLDSQASSSKSLKSSKGFQFSVFTFQFSLFSFRYKSTTFFWNIQIHLYFVFFALHYRTTFSLVFHTVR